MIVQNLQVPAAGRIVEMMVLFGTVIAGIVVQRRLQARILLSQPTVRTGLVGALGVVEAITAFGLVAILALLASPLVSSLLASPESLLGAAGDYGIVQFVVDRGSALLALICVILAGVAYSGRRAAYLAQIDRSRREYMSSIRQRIALGHTFALFDDGYTRPLRQTIRRLESEILELSSTRPEAVEVLDDLYGAHKKATAELAALELKRRISHIDIYGDEILNGPQNHRRGRLLSSLFGSRHLARALSGAGRAMFASGLSLAFAVALLMPLGQVRPSFQVRSHDAAKTASDLRASSWATGLKLQPPEIADDAADADADEVAPQTAASRLEMSPREPHHEPSGALPEHALRSGAPARHHPAVLRKAQRALIANDPFALSLLLLEQGRISEARRILRRLAEGGNHDAALALGSTFDPLTIDENNRKGRNPDPHRAVYWYRKAHRLDR